MTMSLRDARYVALIGTDAIGITTFYFPDGPLAERVEPGADRPLPNSIVLDATAGAERYVVMFCDRPVAVASLMTAPAGCTSESFEVVK
jgi:hypothetical protein